MVRNFLSFSVKTIGSAHVINGKPCQDNCMSYDCDTFSCLAVADGHGGDDYIRSDRGSRFAVESFKTCIKQSAIIDDIDGKKENLFTILSQSTERERKAVFHQLISNIVYTWNEMVLKDFSADCFREEEMEKVSEKSRNLYLSGQKITKAYGTTLIGIVLTESFWFGIHMGDGKCVVLNNDWSFSEPIPWDERCFLNVTSSICDEDSVDKARFFYSEEFPVAIFAGSDGVDDSFNNEESFHNFYKTLANAFSEKDREAAVAELEEFLPRMSQTGSHDDISIVGLIDVKNKKTAENNEKNIDSDDSLVDIKKTEETIS